MRESLIALINERRGWTQNDQLTLKESIARASEGQALIQDHERVVTDLQARGENDGLWGSMLSNWLESEEGQ